MLDSCVVVYMMIPPHFFLRLSREEKQYKRALEQALAQSTSSQPDASTSDKTDHEDRDKDYSLEQEDAAQDSGWLPETSRAVCCGTQSVVS